MHLHSTFEFSRRQKQWQMKNDSLSEVSLGSTQEPVNEQLARENDDSIMCIESIVKPMWNTAKSMMSFHYHPKVAVSNNDFCTWISTVKPRKIDKGNHSMLSIA